MKERERESTNEVTVHHSKGVIIYVKESGGDSN